jgi:hypothetical protein
MYQSNQARDYKKKSSLLLAVGEARSRRSQRPSLALAAGPLSLSREQYPHGPVAQWVL